MIRCDYCTSGGYDVFYDVRILIWDALNREDVNGVYEIRRRNTSARFCLCIRLWSRLLLEGPLLAGICWGKSVGVMTGRLSAQLLFLSRWPFSRCLPSGSLHPRGGEKRGRVGPVKDHTPADDPSADRLVKHNNQSTYTLRAGSCRAHMGPLFQ